MILFRSYCIKTFSGHLDWVRSVVPSEDGRYLVTASNDQVKKKQICVNSTKRIFIYLYNYRLRDFGMFKQESQKWNLEVMNMYWNVQYLLQLIHTSISKN